MTQECDVKDRNLQIIVRNLLLSVDLMLTLD